MNTNGKVKHLPKLLLNGRFVSIILKCNKVQFIKIPLIQQIPVLLTMTMSRFSHSWSGTVNFSTSSSDIPLKRSRFFRDTFVESVEVEDVVGADGEHFAI